MKVLGAEIVAFFESEWPDDDYFVDGSNKSVVNGAIFTDEDTSEKNPLPLEDKYDINDFGALSCIGSECPSLTTYFKRWKNALTTVTLVAQVPKEKEQEVRDILKQAGAIVK